MEARDIILRPSSLSNRWLKWTKALHIRSCNVHATKTASSQGC
jgi:hypothetical protein